MASRNCQFFLFDALPFLDPLPLDLLRRRRVGMMNTTSGIGTDLDDLTQAYEGIFHLASFCRLKFTKREEANEVLTVQDSSLTLPSGERISSRRTPHSKAIPPSVNSQKSCIPPNMNEPRPRFPEIQRPECSERIPGLRIQPRWRCTDHVHPVSGKGHYQAGGACAFNHFFRSSRQQGGHVEVGRFVHHVREDPDRL